MENSASTNQANQHTIAILSFHKIGQPPPNGWETWFYIPETTFVDYLTYLQKNNWQVIDLATFVQGLITPDILPKRSALLTFDDGYQSMLTTALPLLLKFGYPGVIFVPTDFIGEHNSFDTDCEPEEPICTWDELHELERYNVSVQPHGVTHRAFSYLSLAEQEEELSRSKATLEAGLKKRVDVFCYPYGDDGRDPQAIKKVLQRVGYQAGCLYGGDPVSVTEANANPYRLPRLAMGPDTDLPAILEPEAVPSAIFQL
ncbi:MAG: polysaccharide deacetylase family protein [Brasilonema angustatum HA4187-MV1]|nr:polysaccharide deacetylase family protein [Brasilonema angustatum HA4187-MV1]